MFYIFSGRMTETIHRLFRKAENCFILRSLNRLIAAVLHLMPIIYDMTTMTLPVIDQIYWRVSVCLMKRNAVHFNYQAHQPKRWFGLNSVWLRRYNQIYNLCCWKLFGLKAKTITFFSCFYQPAVQVVGSLTASVGRTELKSTAKLFIHLSVWFWQFKPLII